MKLHTYIKLKKQNVLNRVIYKEFKQQQQNNNITKQEFLLIKIFNINCST